MPDGTTGFVARRQVPRRSHSPNLHAGIGGPRLRGVRNRRGPAECQERPKNRALQSTIFDSHAIQFSRILETETGYWGIVGAGNAQEQTSWTVIIPQIEQHQTD